jgi:hypothetical protein
LRAEIVKSGCSLESRKFPAFYNATIFPPNARREFFNRIDPLQALATVGFGAIKSQTLPKTSIGGGAPPETQILATQ